LNLDALDEAFEIGPEAPPKPNGHEPPAVTTFDAFGDGDVVVDEPAPPDGVCQTLLTTAAWWRDPTTIPKREFLFGRHYIRGAIGATIGGGGRGKTTLGTCEAISLAAGRDLLTGATLESGPLRVVVLNAEEDQDELDRRFAATCKRYGISQSDLGGRLFAISVRNRPLRIATLIKNVPTLNPDVIAQMTAFIKQNAIDVFMLDPFVSFHSVNENVNTDMDLVIKEGLGSIASATNSAGEIFHHPGKPKIGQVDTTVDDSRGASAIIWAVRSARVLNFMSPADAQEFGIGEDVRRRHIRIANGKANMGPSGEATWMRLEIENMPNGDTVACSTLWKPPDPFKGMTTRDVEVGRKVAQGGAHRADSQSPLWFGYALAEHLNINVRYGRTNKKEDLARIKAIIKKWLKNNVLDTEFREDEKRKKRQYIIPGTFHIPDPMGGYSDDEMQIQ
jgi:RecA-family ATPase